MVNTAFLETGQASKEKRSRVPGQEVPVKDSLPSFQAYGRFQTQNPENKRGSGPWEADFATSGKSAPWGGCQAFP